MGIGLFCGQDSWPAVGELIGQGPGCLPLWKALQLKSFLRTLPHPRLFRRALTEFEKICNTMGQLKHTLSLLYKMLLAPDPVIVPGCVSKWMRDLEVDWPQETIRRMIIAPHQTSICANIQEAGYKVLTRWYRTPCVLHKQFPEVSNLCWRCGREPGTLLHIFWLCSGIQDFWGKLPR